MSIFEVCFSVAALLMCVVGVFAGAYFAFWIRARNLEEEYLARESRQKPKKVRRKTRIETSYPEENSPVEASGRGLRERVTERADLPSFAVSNSESVGEDAGAAIGAMRQESNEAYEFLGTHITASSEGQQG